MEGYQGNVLALLQFVPARFLPSLSSHDGDGLNSGVLITTGGGGRYNTSPHKEESTGHGGRNLSTDSTTIIIKKIFLIQVFFSKE